MTKVVVNGGRTKGVINRNIYGHFAEHLGRCIYEGLYVGEDSDIPNKNGMRNDVVDALKEMKIPLLRWPGGCFADDYHWRDGIGEKTKRPYMVNTNWGGVVENNHFGTHEFFELCEQLEAEPYICGNVGSGTVQEMRDWVEYMTFDGNSPLANERRENGREKPWKLKYFGVGNENWGCGGNMRAEYYADEYRRFATFIRNYGEEPIYKIAGGPNVDDGRWTEVLMQNIRHATNGISLHNYTFEDRWEVKGDSLNFDEKGWFGVMKNALKMEKIINLHESIMDRYDPDKRIGLIVDEWGNWFDVMPGTNPGFLYQQNTIRDAVSAVIILHIFHNHCDRVVMANIAQMVNVLQAVILTEGEKMVLTPTYHVMKMMAGHQDGNIIDIDYQAGETGVDGINVPKISISASEKEGVMTISACNTSLTEAEEVQLEIRDITKNSVTATVVTATEMNAHNTFDAPDNVKEEKLEAVIENGVVKFTMPAMSVVALTLK